jgi:hypothetical protein
LRRLADEDDKDSGGRLRAPLSREFRLKTSRRAGAFPLRVHHQQTRICETPRRRSGWPFLLPIFGFIKRTGPTYRPEGGSPASKNDLIAHPSSPRGLCRSGFIRKTAYKEPDVVRRDLAAIRGDECLSALQLTIASDALVAASLPASPRGLSASAGRKRNLAKHEFKPYPIGWFHFGIAEVRTCRAGSISLSQSTGTA